MTIDLDQFVNFARRMEGVTLVTGPRKKPFRVYVSGDRVTFVPEVSGKPRRLKFAEIQVYVDSYNAGARVEKEFAEAHKQRNLSGKPQNVSYFLPLVNEYEKPQNEIFRGQDEDDLKKKTTEIETLSMARIGQGKFRKDLLEFWDGACAVTGVRNEELLRASHIKPWRDADNSERLDKHNGLLLTPDLDVLFDRGLITFSDDGKIKISSEIPLETLNKIGINEEMELKKQKISDGHKHFLKYHRENIFRN